MQNKKITIESILPFAIFFLFLAVSLPGNSWGAPALWNPDELIWRVDSALRGELIFDVTEPDANYPSLPKYIMYLIGLLVYGTGHSNFAFIVAARSFSGVLGGLVGVLVYFIARKVGANKKVSALAGVFYILSGEVAANARFAHNDLYLLLFCVLCLYCVLRFQETQKTGWLYASFALVGMAASCKYTGASMVLLPVTIFIFMNWKTVRTRILSSVGVILTGGLFVILGYGIGTPRLFIAPMDYLSKAVPAALRNSQYGYNSGYPIGLYGQWGTLRFAVGDFLYLMFISGFIWAVLRLILRRADKSQANQNILILILNVILFDLPYLISINYSPRHFIPFMPLLAISAALMVYEIVRLVSDRRLVFARTAIYAMLTVGIVYSSLRLVSISLLFMNDARIPAGEYIAEIRGYGKSIEYTLYPPRIDKKRFLRAHNYPIYFVKYEGEVVPTGGRIEFNLGQQGLLDRNTDYLVIDSFTYGRFYTETVCETNPVECDFFKNLIAGKVSTFRLAGSFSYQLPGWLPQVTVTSVNPDVLFFERVR